MSRDLTAIFNAKLQQVVDYYMKWSTLHKKIDELLKETQPEEGRNIAKIDHSLQAVVKRFTEELESPRITLATTGTTSGGKSSLVNLLCGAEIMPVAVQEMSAGTVIIDHSNERTLKIPAVADVPPEYCGEWHHISDEEIRHRLQIIMDAYRQLREENREPPAPRIILEYPTRLGMRPELSGFPHGFKLRIIDLPGLKYVSDDHNRQVIRDEIKPALCLVTYNSEETDPEKQQRLLDEVVSQVRELRGSPARMLFILNRIDVFRRDLEWEDRTRLFAESVTDKIRTSVGRALPEYRKQADGLRVQPLSTYPALCAYRALHAATEDDRIEAMERIDSKFHFLIPKECVDELPRKITRWSEEDRQRVATEVWRTSFGEEFDRTLQAHIRANLPQLLLPHLIKSVVDIAALALTTVHQTTYAHLNATQERYQSECNRLNTIRGDLQKLREKSRQQLLDAINFSEEDQDIIEELTDIASNLQSVYGLPKDSLVPLYDWSAQLGNTIESFLSAIHKTIVEGHTIPRGQLIDSLPPQDRETLSQVLAQLQEVGYYGNFAIEGGHYDTEKDEEKDRLVKMNMALNDLAEALAVSLKRVLNYTAEREAARIQDALQLLTEGYAHFINDNAQTVAPGLSGLIITPSNLVRVTQRLLLNFQLTAGFTTYHYKKDIKVGEEKVKIDEKRKWYTLWVQKEEVYTSRPVYQKRSYDAAVIPNITEIFTGFITQAKASRHETEFVRWLRTQLDEFLTGIDTYQESLLQEYQGRLDQAMSQATKEKEINISNWKSVAAEVAGLQSELPELLRVA